MKFGLSLSNNQGIEDVQDIVRLAVRAEALGLDSVWASDHVFNVSPRRHARCTVGSVKST